MTSLKSNRTFWTLAGMDICARSGYQMGKSPLLPILALSVGAGKAELGLAASASVVTGMILKPWFGAASDRWGRRPVLIIGSLFFTLIPLLYLYVDTVWNLIGIRIVHGLSTAMYGPVMAAMVADLFVDRKQGYRRYGLYDTFRSVGYVTGPFLGGLALKLFADPRHIYLIVGMFGLCAFLASLFVRSTAPASLTDEGTRRARRPSILYSIATGVRQFILDKRVRNVVGLELTSNLVTRWTKVFWVVWVAEQFDPVFIGTIISVIFAMSLCCKSVSGWLATRFGPDRVLVCGALLTAGGMIGLFFADSALLIVVSAIVMGTGDGLIMPCVLSLIAYSTESARRGSVLGVLGSCRNVGKAMGPLLGGIMVQAVGTIPTMLCGSIGLGVLAIHVWSRRLKTGLALDADDKKVSQGVNGG
jgi:MFS family permease